MSSSNLQRLRTINSANKRRLLDNVGFATIRDYRNANPEFRNDNQAYQSLLRLYNIPSLTKEEDKFYTQF
jgi:hypothetical protein